MPRSFIPHPLDTTRFGLVVARCFVLTPKNRHSVCTVFVEYASYSLSDGGSWSKMKAFRYLLSQISSDFHDILLTLLFYSFDTCSKWLIMTLLYKTINFILVYSQNCFTSQMVKLLKYPMTFRDMYKAVAKSPDKNGCKIS